MEGNLSQPEKRNDESLANSDLEKQGGGKSAFPISDQRPEAKTQFKLQEIANKGMQMKSRGFQEMANNSPQYRKGAQFKAMADAFTIQQHKKPVSNSEPPAVAQGKWFRMSTNLSPQDEEEIAEIQGYANKGKFFLAFLRVVKKHPSLLIEFNEISKYFKDKEIADAAFNVLWETFEAPGKAYTAAEVIGELKNNEIINEDDKFIAKSAHEDDDIEQLTNRFKMLHVSLPFRSDIDNRKAEHHVAFEKNVIMIKSNPVPLGTIVSTKKWEGITLPATILAQLAGLNATAQTALYNIAGKKSLNIKGARTKTNMDAFRNALGAIAKVLSNLKGAAHKGTLMPLTDLSASENFGVNKNVEGTHVKATPLSIKSNTSGSKPHDGRLMKSIRQRAGSQSKSYVQMHLLNDLVYGPGQLWNLTPGPKQSNVDMETKVEHPLKKAILGKGLVIEFAAKVNYASNPNSATQKQLSQNPDKYRFQSIKFTAKELEYDDTTKKWSTATTQDADVSSINGTVNWRYGSLQPLTPKPRILDPATTVSDLTAVNVTAGAAKRIVAFVQANPTWKPKGGGNKQTQLALAVKAFDKGRSIPNMSKWKATAVLWT